MKYLKLNIFFASIMLWSLFSGCSEGHDHDHSPEAEMPMEESDEVGLTKEQLEKINLTLGKIEQKNLRSALKVNGMLELPPQNKANVSALAAGKVTKITVQPGQQVSKGMVLATIQNPSFIDWQQAYLEVKGTLMFLEKEYSRQKELVESEVAPQKQFEKIASDLAIAQAQLKGLKSRLNTLGIPIPKKEDGDFKTVIAIRSPLNGFVREIKINTGVFVEPQRELFEIVDNHHLHIDFLVFEKDLPSIKKGQIVTFNLQSQPKNVMQAKVFAIGKAINEKDRSISVHAEIIDETTELVPGMYVEGRIILENQKVPALPEEAITVDKGLHYIFVKEEEHEDEVHFKKIAVLLGVSDFGYVEITTMEKLDETAEIAIGGAYFLMAQSKKGEESGGGHSH